MTAAGTFEDVKVSSVASDWSKTPGDVEYAPVQRNYGDYITLAAHRKRLVAAWTCGRTGQSRIYVRIMGLAGAK